MARHSLLFQLLVAALALSRTAAFAIPRQHEPATLSTVRAAVPNANGSTDSNDARTFDKPMMEKIGHFATTAAVVLSTSPLMALAEDVADDYEYGAVNAPIWIAWAGGALAILTALLPVALRGGEEAFEEMKERDAGKFGTGDSSALDRRRRR
jgi:hypothetical protein